MFLNKLITMDKRKSIIHGYEKEMQKLSVSADEELTRVGRTLFDGYTAQLAGSPCAQPLKHIKELIKEKTGLKKEAEVVRETEAKAENIREELQGLLVKQKELDKTMPSLLEAVGILAYQLYRQEPGVLRTYDALFADIKTYSEEVAAIEAAILDTGKEKKEKPFFEKLAGRGQNVLLKGKRMIKERNLPGAFRKLGAALVETDLFKGTVPEDLKSAHSEYVKKRKDQLSLSKEIEYREAKLAAVEKDITALTDNRRVDRKISEIRKQVEQNSSSLEVAYYSLGRIFYNEKPAAVKPDQDLKSLLSNLDSVYEQIDSLTGEIEHLRAGIEFDRLKGMIEDAEKSIRSYEIEVGKYQLKIRNARMDIERFEKERDKLDV